MDDGCYESAVLMVIMITNAMAWTGLTHHVEKQAGDGQHWPFLVCIQAPECCRAHRLYEHMTACHHGKHRPAISFRTYRMRDIMASSVHKKSAFVFVIDIMNRVLVARIPCTNLMLFFFDNS